jgi:hypothetical protein
LIDGADGSLLWSEQFDRPGSDIIGIQEAITRGVSERLRPGLSSSDRANVTRHDTADPEAYRLYLRGRYHWSKLNPEGWTRGAEYFQQAIDRDPTYARAYAGLADCYNLRGVFDYCRRGKRFHAQSKQLSGPWKSNRTSPKPVLRSA